MASPQKLQAEPPPLAVTTYFNNFHSSKWNIIHFLEHQLPNPPIPRDRFSIATQIWLRSLEYLIGVPTHHEHAEKLLAQYQKGRWSDQARATSWLRSVNSGGRVDKISLKKRTLKIPPVHRTPKNHNPVLQRHPSRNIDAPVINATNIYGLTLNQSISDEPLNKDALQVTNKPKVNDEDKSYRNNEDEVDTDNEDGGDEDYKNKMNTLRVKLASQYNGLEDPFKFKTGRILEDICQEYALHLDDLGLVHLKIVDFSMRSQFTSDEWEELKDKLPALPSFPSYLDECLQRCSHATTAAECDEVTRRPHTRNVEWMVDEKWIENVMYHIFQLLTVFHSLDGLREGTWDSTVHPPFWDQYFMDLPHVILERKELPLVAFKDFPDPYVNNTSLFNAVVRLAPTSAEHFFKQLGGGQIKFAVFEVSSCFAARKWNIDRTKLLAACRACLCRLEKIVDNDVGTMEKLSVFGVLQAGRYTQIYVINRLGTNLVFLQEGDTHELPRRTSVGDLEKAYDLISIIWKCKKILHTSSIAVIDYLESKLSGDLGPKKKAVRRTASGFL